MASDLVRYVKAKPFISKELMRKDKLTTKDRRWVYNDLYALAISFALLVVSIVWLSLPLTEKPEARAIAALSSLGVLFSLIVMCMRIGGHNDPLTNRKSVVLSYTGRKNLIMYERSRLNAPHRADRTNYPREAQRKYNQYSVWVAPLQHGVSLYLVEHVPQRFPFKRYDAGMFVPPGYREPIVEHMKKRPSLEDVIETQHTLEEMAAKAEQASYGSICGSLEYRSMAFNLRR